jgi:hypothetical protein
MPISAWVNTSLIEVNRQEYVPFTRLEVIVLPFVNVKGRCGKMREIKRGVATWVVLLWEVSVPRICRANSSVTARDEAYLGLSSVHICGCLDSK